jgi:hypothetical protein
MFSYTVSSWVLMSFPATHAFPDVGPYIPVSIEIKVVLPAPLGPSKPNISPLLILKEKFFVATLGGMPPIDGYTLCRSLIINGYLGKSYLSMLCTSVLSAFASESSSVWSYSTGGNSYSSSSSPRSGEAVCVFHRKFHFLGTP